MKHIKNEPEDIFFTKKSSGSFLIPGRGRQSRTTDNGVKVRCLTAWRCPHKVRQYRISGKKKWGEWWDSNPRVTEPQSAVLTTSPHPPYFSVTGISPYDVVYCTIERNIRQIVFWKKFHKMGCKKKILLPCIERFIKGLAGSGIARKAYCPLIICERGSAGSIGSEGRAEVVRRIKIRSTAKV